MTKGTFKGAGRAFRVDDTTGLRLERKGLNSQGTRLDEVVIDHWFHLEMMDLGHYHLIVGDRAFSVRVIDGGNGAQLVEQDR